MNNQNNINTKEFVLDIDLSWDSKVKDKNFIAPDNSGFKITDGVWFIPKGTEWDGTTYVPDGPEDPNKPGFPITWKASLIHDMGCRYWYYKCFPYNRRKINKFFFQLMKEVKFEYRRLYYWGVSIYGAFLDFLYSTILRKKPC